MTDCQRCGGRATTFLCPRCTTTLKTTLAQLPWWLDRLTETAIGQTRMSDNGGRKSARRKDLDGDAELAACIETLPPNKDDDLERARKAREKLALAHALATGGINARASELLSEIADSLGYWCRVLCEARGFDYAPDRSGRSLGANHAHWLHANVGAIACHEDADTIAGEIEQAVEDIVAVVNRPIRWWALGHCPGEVDGHPCGTELRVPEETEEVKCRRCKVTHNVHRLIWSRKSEAETVPKTAPELTRYNRELPPEYQVPPRTLQHWLATGRLCACGTNGTDPLYSWIDVRLLMIRKPQKATTGAAARKTGS